MYDVVIIGKSYIGKLTALNLSNHLPHLKICMVDKNKSDYKPQDQRATALSQSSIQLLNSLSLWNTLEAYSAPIEKIIIGMNTNETPITLKDKAPLGYNLSNSYLTSALDEKLQTIRSIDYYHGHAIKTLMMDTAYATIVLENDTRIQSRLIIGADGRFSSVRSLLTSIRTINYNQTALTGTLHHEYPHKNRAFEFFIPQGPLAFIPLNDPNTSTFVWSLKDPLLPPENYIQTILSNLMQNYLGNINHLAPAQRYPLAAFLAKERTGHRWVLLGDAANAIHPVAGQGMNLAIRDIKTLTEHLSKQCSLGLDLGSHTHLKHYAKIRQADRYSLFSITHASAKWLTTPHPSMRSIFNQGMKLFNTHPILSQLAVNNASFGL